MSSLASDLELLTEDMPLADYDPAAYSDIPATPPPPAAGNYRIKLNRYGLRKKDGELVLWGGHKVLTINEFEITEPMENAKRVKGWFDVKTGPEPFQRDGKEVRQIIDLLRSLDQTRTFSSVNQALALLDELVKEGLEARVKLDWFAYDADYVREQFVAATGVPNPTTDQAKAALGKEAVNAIYKKAKLTSMFQFPKMADGRFSNFWGGVDGTKKIEAKPVIVRYYASLDPGVKLGPQS